MQRIYEPRAYGPEPDAGNFWRTTLVPQPGDPAADGTVRCDFAVIGAGYTGLNAALELAESGADVAVFEAETPGWGASGRNGGFCCIGGDKLSAAGLIRRHGRAEADIYFRAQRAAIDLVDGLLDQHGIDADRHSRGETQLAHRRCDADRYPAMAEEMHAIHGARATVHSRAELAEQGLAGPEFHGALTLPFGFALNPAKYLSGLAAAARSAGVRQFARSPVTAMAPVGAGWRLATPRARVEARAIIVATNGYSSENLPHWLAGRYLPVQSAILVTRPLTGREMRDQGFTSRQMCYDSRRLLHYFRLMPDNRFLFGMRGAIRADAAAHSSLFRALLRDFRRMFPAWSAVEATHSWSGLACLSRRRTPFAGPLGDLPGAFGAFAYHGNGVAMGSYCGRLAAAHALGRRPARPCPAFLSLPPRRFELGRHRRTLLRLAYHWYAARDRQE